ncbi:hypothetical protein ACFL59_12225 [Planctomycetota bacterium]
MRMRPSLQRFAICFALVSQLGLAAAGCRQEGGVSAAKPDLAGHAASASARISVGEITYAMVKSNLEQSPDNAQQKVDVLVGRHDEFVTAVDAIVPAEVAGSLGSTLDDVTALVDDGTLPDLCDNLASVLGLLADDPADPNQDALRGLVTLAGSRSPLDGEMTLRLASRLLKYTELEALLQAVAQVLRENDGLDVAGNPTAAERDLVMDLLGVLSRALSGLDRPTSARSGSLLSQDIVDVLLRKIQLRGTQVGEPAWAVWIDKHGNAQVSRQPNGQIEPPFVDADRDGAADVNADGCPVDGNGAIIAIAPFGEDGSRDQYRRALSARGELLYEYFDAKLTPLGQVARMLGDLIRRDVPAELVKGIDSLAPLTTKIDPATGESYPAYSDDNPLLDLGWAGLEVFRYRDAPKLLDAAAALINNDPGKAETLLVKVLEAADIIANTPMSAPSSAHTGSSTLDDLQPLLDQTFEVNSSSGQSAARLLLHTFTAEQARLRNLPLGFARMMKYSDWMNRVPTQPGQVSMMERLLDMMVEANRCDSWPFGNMAEFYLDAMAGNQKIDLGFVEFNISVSTINMLMDITALRQLLCSHITEANVRALAAFAQSGALDAMIPIAKAFSDAGETKTLKNVFLTLQSSYGQTMRPLEPALIQVLESGAIELLFEVLDDMNRVRVPGTGEPVSDRIADFLEAVVDDDRVVENRRGQRVTTLLHLLLEPFEDISARTGSNGGFDRALSEALDVIFATTMDQNGTPGNPNDDFRVLLNHSLIPLTAATLKSMADGMSVYPWIRNQDITSYQQSIEDLLTGRDFPVIVEVFLAFDRSSTRQQIHQAISNVLTPNSSADQDIYGSVLEIGAALLQAKTDPAATVDVLRFAGRALDPARGWSKKIVVGLTGLIGGNSGSTIVSILRNALDRGPDGTLQSPLETILSVISAIEAVSTHVAQPLTVQSLRQDILDLVHLIRDPDQGLAWMWNNIRNR